MSSSPGGGGMLIHTMSRFTSFPAILCCLTCVAVSCGGGGGTTAAPQSNSQFTPDASSPLPPGDYFKASNTRPGDAFGTSVSASSDGATVVVGAPLEASSGSGVVAGKKDGDDHSAAGSGAAYVFFRGNGGWVQQAYLKASNARAGSFFGWSVALSGDGNTLAIGSYGEAAGATGVAAAASSDTSSPEAGAVYLFKRAEGMWQQAAYLKPSNAQTKAWFGASVAFSQDGQLVAVGAPRENSAATGINAAPDGALNWSGAVYIFKQTPQWSQVAYVKPSNTSADAQFGSSVALSAAGDSMAVGASHECSSGAGVAASTPPSMDTSKPTSVWSGAAYVFRDNGGQWAQTAFIKASTSMRSANFGASVALSGDGTRMAVGSPNEPSASTGINGNQSDVTAPGSGAAYLFSSHGSSWQQDAYVKASNTQRTTDRINANFGTSLLLSTDGLRLAVGAPFDASSGVGVNPTTPSQLDTQALGAGAVFLFSGLDSGWTQVDYVKPSNTWTHQPNGGVAGFGAAIAFSKDGVVVGAPNEAGGSTGVDGNQMDRSAPLSGATYLVPVKK